MKINKPTKEIKKFDLEKMEVAKLKNMHLIKGGGGDTTTGDVDTNNHPKGSSNPCDEQIQ
jgi:hypothetical protein